MPGVICNAVNQMADVACNGNYPDGVASPLMNPLHEAMNPLNAAINKEQKDGMSDHMDLMREMIATLHQRPESGDNVDLGGKDKRPADLTMHFDPKMDQDINLYSGRGDDMVIIV